MEKTQSSHYKKAEEVFINLPRVLFFDEKHSKFEQRFIIWGITNKNRKLTIIFTIRNKKFKIISARDINKKEKREYEKKLKPILKFKTEDQKRDFWAKSDIAEYFDTDKAIVNPSFPNLKPSSRTITIRIPESLLFDLKMLANKKDVPYQSLMKIFLAERVK